MSKIVVFGGAGFIGQNLIMTLLNKGESDVVSFDLAKCPILPESSLLGNLLDEEAVRQAITGADFVFNLAGMADIEQCAEMPVEAVKTNILGSTILMNACVEQKVSRVLLASSVYATTRLGGFYRSTKLACESLLKDFNKYYGLDYTILRYGTVYGRGANEKNSIYRFLKQAIQDGKISYQGDGTELREYIHVLDASDLTIEAMKEEHKNKCLVLTGQRQTTVEALFAMISEILGKNIPVEYKNPLHAKLLKSHYKTTPYSYVKDMSKKLAKTEYVDLGRGLLDCIEEIENVGHGTA